MNLTVCLWDIHILKIKCITALNYLISYILYLCITEIWHKTEHCYDFCVIIAPFETKYWKQYYFAEKKNHLVRI